MADRLSQNRALVNNTSESRDNLLYTTWCLIRVLYLLVLDNTELPYQDIWYSVPFQDGKHASKTVMEICRLHSDRPQSRCHGAYYLAHQLAMFATVTVVARLGS